MTVIRTATILMFLAAILIFLLTANDKKIRELVNMDVLAPISNQPAKNAEAFEAQPITFPDIIPLSEFGDFNLKKIQEKKIIKKKPPKKEKKIKKTRLVKKKKIKASRKIIAPKPVPVTLTKPLASAQSLAKPKAKKTPTRPQFLLGYNEIGLETYLRVVERIGTLHLVLFNGEKPRYGPAISFAKRKISSDELDQDNLAIERPYSVTDRDLPKHLGLFALPMGSLEGQLVLFLNKPFDELLWDTLTTKLSRRNYGLSDITSVNGEYIREAQHIIIFLEKAITKAGKTIKIDTYLDVPCDNCT